MLPVTCSWLFLAFGARDSALGAMAVLGLSLAVIGCIDDLRPIRPRVRLVIHLAAAGTMVASTFVATRCEPMVVALLSAALATIVITWSLNLFNFMDGIDGLAASEGLCIGFGGIMIMVWNGADAPLTTALAALVGALIGFLPWNAPKARMFMGDAGSTWLGFSLATIALQDSLRFPDRIPVWLMLPALFVADATVCVVRRLLRGEKITTGHRAHAYQNLSRMLGSHFSVVVAFAVCNAVILAAAGFSTVHAAWAWPMLVAVYTGAIGLAFAGRSGQHGVADSGSTCRGQDKPGS